MNAVDEFSRTRVTLGYAAENYGFEVVPEFCSGVTVTSVASDVRKVRPGALFAPTCHVDRRQLEAARDAGAYAALVPPEFKAEANNIGMPLLISSFNPISLGKLVCDVNNDPSSCVATFAVAGDDDDDIHANVLRLADFLHMLGNPVGIISDAGSSSLQRELQLDYPLGIADLQHNLSVCVEDGAAAVVIALNSQTLEKDALQSVNIDVLGVESEEKRTISLIPPTPPEESIKNFLSTNSYKDSSKNENIENSNSSENSFNANAIHSESSKDFYSDSKLDSKDLDSKDSNVFVQKVDVKPVVSFYSLQQRYGFYCRERSYCITRTKESDELADLVDSIGGKDVNRHLSLSIAMVLAAGVRRGTIKSALRVSRELH